MVRNRVIFWERKKDNIHIHGIVCKHFGYLLHVYVWVTHMKLRICDCERPLQITSFRPFGCKRATLLLLGALAVSHFNYL